ncbi:MAG: aminoacyl-tRNA hydrolase [Patescibacteria group bacterium]
MKVILGLGNPGVEYANTRHNAGIMLVDVLSAKCQGLSSYGWRREKNKMVFKTNDFTLIKTANVFMNESGYLTLNPSPNLGEGQNFFVAHDDLDLRLGHYKIQKGVGPKLHNGIESVEKALKTKDFWRIRIGIDNRITPVDGETYVLQRFSPEERKILDSVLENIVKAVMP